MNTDEVWKDVIGYEGYYQVSDQGRVRSLDRVIHRNNGRILPKKSKLMTIKSDGFGYLIANLSKGNVRKSPKVHKLVSAAFLPNTENKPQINHIDGNKSNNRLSNLEWCTALENQMHAIRTGLKTFKYGESHPQCKLTDREVAIIRMLNKDYNVPCTKLADIFAISHTQAKDIVGNKSRIKKDGDSY